jgi:RNA polymerase sigma factor (sigma-70 family)
MYRSKAARRNDRDEFILDTIRDNATSLLRLARRYSECSADADDAYQRAIEIFLKRVDHVERDTAGAWLRTVVKHEAMAIKEQRRRQGVGSEDIDFDREISPRLPDETERLRSFDQMERAAEALAQLKPQEVRALVLKAKGYSYDEIAEICGWTFTKVNRCITEGRRAFLDRCAAIERGDECRRLEPILSALADGEATPKQLLEVRPHLRHCAACRATVREFHLASHRAAALVPIAAVVGGAQTFDAGASFFARLYEFALGGVAERATMSATRIQTMAEAAAGSKAAAVAASAAAIAGGGVGVQRAATASETQRPVPVVREASSNQRPTAPKRVPTNVSSAPATPTRAKKHASKPTAVSREVPAVARTPVATSAPVTPAQTPETQPVSSGSDEFAIE